MTALRKFAKCFEKLCGSCDFSCRAGRPHFRQMLAQTSWRHWRVAYSTGQRRSAFAGIGASLTYFSAAPVPDASAGARKDVHIAGKTFRTDSIFNVPRNVLALTSRSLHREKDHPVCIVRQMIESAFPSPTFKHYNNLHPVVSTFENFDSLGFPADHAGRAPSDTYYINRSTLLRTHTSAHELQLFRAAESDGYLVSADVYRRDEVNKSHYPVFHQTEGARVWDRANGDVVNAIYDDLERLPKHTTKVEDGNPPFDPERNPLQAEHHSAEEAEAVVTHLKRSLELLMVDIFTRARAAAVLEDPKHAHEPLQARWLEAYFPFTSPSWELEVYHKGAWLEVLGCGVTQHHIHEAAGRPTQLGWAFGIGLERIAMLLFQIPDIRLFWSHDQRFLDQFAGVSDNFHLLRRFVPFSKHPVCYKDVSFWLPSTTLAAGGKNTSTHHLHAIDAPKLIYGVAGDVVQDVCLVDEFTHPGTGRKSVCLRINYHSFERTLTNEEVNRLHEEVRSVLSDKLGVELR